MRARPARLFGVILGVLAASAASAQPGPRVAVAKSVSPAATFWARPSNGNQFRTLPDKDDLYAGDMLVSLPGGTFVTKNGAVTVKSLADFDTRSATPVLETALSLSESKDFDLDLTLDRGSVSVANSKSGGSATARVRFWDQSWKIILDSPGARVALELYGRWPPGTRFKLADPGADPAQLPAPVASLALVVLNGTASVEFGGVTVAMKAPPGPAELQWNSLTGVRPQPLKLEQVPAWADPSVVTEDAKKFAAAVEKFRLARAADPAKAIETFLASPDPNEQRIALVALGAMDELNVLGKSLIAAKTLDEWDFGVVVLRHWLGRAKGQDQKYYQALTTIRGYTDGQARIILQLLFGFSAEDLMSPETYEVLIDYLIHEKPAIRNLAAWHLVRLVPQGRMIAYKPDGSREDVEKAYAEWKKLVPSGQLPPPKKE
jgi:hypothetical protein